MNVKQKFIMLSAVAGAVMAVVSIVGYFVASGSVSATVEKEIVATIKAEANEAEAWLLEKGQLAQGVASILQHLPAAEEDMAKSHDLTQAVADDNEMTNLIHAREDGFTMALHGGNQTGTSAWTKRAWYTKAKAAGKLIFTDPYVSKTTGDTVCAAGVPYQREGAPSGVIGVMFKTDTLAQKAKEIKFDGQGKGMIVNPATGIILASGDEKENLKPIADNPALQAHINDMASKKAGYFIAKTGKGDMVVAYETLPSSGWIAVVSVSAGFVFAELVKLRIIYGILTLLGATAVVVMLLYFSDGIVRQIKVLVAHINEISQGNLRIEPLEITSEDEFGQMAEQFNIMVKNVRDLIAHMMQGAEQVASSSEELTAGSQQAAEAATNIAQTIGDVVEGMGKQLKNVTDMKRNIDDSFVDINDMSDKASAITKNTEQMATAADQGAKLMLNAMDRMGSIEQSVSNSAQVVKKLGKNSEQIEEIVESISAIAHQTNLLALNASIEAARAGEAGRGFSVVAGEVKKLAEQSQQAVEQIKDRISIIQNDTKDAVAAMEVGTGEVARGTQAIHEVGEQFKDITSRVASVKNEMEQINGAMQTVSKGMQSLVCVVDDIESISRTTSESTQTISAAAEEQSAVSQEIATASHSLADLAAKLQTATSEFRV